MKSQARGFPPHLKPKRQKLVPLVGVAFGLLLLLILPFPSLQIPRLFHPLDKSEGVRPRIINQWEHIEPSTSLKFEKCFGDFECARLDVPMDWTAPDKEGGKRVAVAVAKLPAKVPVTDPRYGGAVLINPGGPGGSGVNLAILDGAQIQTIVDYPASPDELSYGSPDGKYYDVIGFDPRGVNNTTPSPGDCFPDDVSMVSWARLVYSQGNAHSNGSFGLSWGRSRSLAKSCTWKWNEDEHTIGKHLSTPNVVEDMVAIVEAMGEWREAQAQKLMAKSSQASRQETMERVKWQKGKEKLFYWGFSYGTVLGATFVTLHPDRVGRVALDGVMDPNDYYSTRWLTNLLNTDAVADSLFLQCYDAGPALCPLYQPSLEKIKSSYLDTLAALDMEPLSIPADENYGPEIFTYDDFSKLIVPALYSPTIFPVTALAIKQIQDGNVTGLARAKQILFPDTCKSPSCQRHPWSSSCHDPNIRRFTSAISSAILCTDGEDIRSWTGKDHWKKWQTLLSQSQTMAGWWNQNTMPCSEWDMRPAWQFNGTTGAEKTSHPVLLLSNTRDPVTPLADAYSLAKRLPGSVVFGQDADGHCTIAQPSRCVAKGIREYFQTGAMPEGGVNCKPDSGIFGQPIDRQDVVLSRADVALSGAVKAMSSRRRDWAFPLGV